MSPPNSYVEALGKGCVKSVGQGGGDGLWSGQHVRMSSAGCGAGEAGGGQLRGALQAALRCLGLILQVEE